MIKVEVIFAPHAEQLWRKKINLPRGATLEHALVHSGFYQAHAQQWHEAPCGVFGVQRDRDYRLNDGDQIEVYRPLVFDPMESRRRRAAHRARQREESRKK
ncbi:MAG TPA: RnfH family protein [Paenalcaligenes sp.]|nr:RnfH family protein [Paenalcaligenes sp.]